MDVSCDPSLIPADVSANHLHEALQVHFSSKLLRKHLHLQIIRCGLSGAVILGAAPLPRPKLSLRAALI